MTGSDIITKFRNIVDDELDQDLELQLLNDARNEVEDMAIWEILKARSNTFTSSLSLPANFGRVLKVVDVDSDLEYKAIPYEQQDAYDDIAYTYFLDLANNILTITDGNNTNIKRLYYAKTSPDITEDTSWVFPERFHSIIPLKMAELYYAADAGEKQRAWDDRWSNQYERMLGRMYAWNDSLKIRGRRRISTSNYNPKGVTYASV